MRNFMRGVMILFLLIVVAGFTALAIFVVRFDPNQFRLTLESKLSQTLPVSVKMGNLALSWRQGLGIKIDDIRLGGGPGEPPLAQAEALFFHLNPFGLFQMKLEFYEIQLLRPHFLVTRRGDGSTNWDVLAEGGTQKPSPKGGAALFFSKVMIRDGSLYYREETLWPGGGLEIQDIDFEIKQALPGKVEVHGSLEKEAVLLEGKASIFPPLQVEARLRLKELDLDRLSNVYRAQGEGKGFVAGRVIGEMEIRSSGENVSELVSRASGKGDILIEDGSLRNINLVHLLLSRITVIPGLESVLMGTVPPELREEMQGRDTKFDEVRTEFTLSEGLVTIQKLVLSERHFSVVGAGTLSLAGNLALRARLILLEGLSDFLTGRVQELSYLSNSDGHVVVPFVCRGRWNAPEFRPDVADIAKRVVVSKGSEWVGKGLEALSQIMGEKTQ